MEHYIKLLTIFIWKFSIGEVTLPWAIFHFRIFSKIIAERIHIFQVAQGTGFDILIRNYL